MRHPGSGGGDGRPGDGSGGGHGGGNHGGGGHHDNDYGDHYTYIDNNYYNDHHYYGHYRYGHNYNHHYYGYHPYSHGSYFHHNNYSFGLWIGYRGSSWYYCPTYRTHSYVYASPVYTSHYYYGAGTGSLADNAVAAVDRGWQALERGRPSTARREFAKAASLSPSWGLPRIGYAMALSASGHDRAAAPQIRRALSEDPYAMLEVPWSDTLGSLVVELDSHFTTQAYNGVNESESWLMAGAMRVLLGDAEAAGEAAFNAETAGASSTAVEGLLQVVAGYETQTQPDVVEIIE